MRVLGLPETRKLIRVEDMARLMNSIVDPRARAIAMLLAKTGVRRGELIAMDIDDINWDKYSINLKEKAKRSNRVVFFDEECATVLRRWLRLSVWTAATPLRTLSMYIVCRRGWSNPI